MTSTPEPAGPVSLADRFLSATRSARAAARRDDRRIVENDEFVLMLYRMIRALEERAINDPAVLPQVLGLAQRLNEVTNVAIAANADRYGIDPRRGASMMECARLLGMTKQSGSERANRGRAIMAARIEAAGAVPFAERKRERQAVDSANAHANEHLTEYKARHLRVVA